MNNFKIFYNKKTVDLYYNDEKFSFDLNDGDVGDYWNSFTTYDGVVKDVNFYQEDASVKPSFSIYNLDEDGYINTSEEEVIECTYVHGKPENYFK
jgi:hypothetical protein